MIAAFIILAIMLVVGYVANKRGWLDNYDDDSQDGL